MKLVKFISIFVFSLLLSCAPKLFLEITVDPSSVPADGKSYVTINLRVLEENGKVHSLPDQKMSLKTNLGSFDIKSDKKDITIDLIDGAGSVVLYSGTEPGTAKIEVTYVDPRTNVQYYSYTTVEFIQRRLPNAAKTSFYCESQNINMAEDMDVVTVPCYFVPKDIGGNIIEGVEVFFMTEAGSIEKIDEDLNRDGIADDYLYILKKEELTQICDVNPAFPEMAITIGQKVHNPLDGVVNIIAIYRGEEGFNDINGNGQFDSMGEYVPEADSREPFVDVNDDGIYTEITQENCREKFYDSNQNGQYDGTANGQWDGDVMLYKSIKLVISFDPYQDPVKGSRLRMISGGNESENIDIPNGGEQSFVLYVFDKNLNVIPVNDKQSDRINISVTGNVNGIGVGSITRSKITGIHFMSNPYTGDGAIDKTDPGFLNYEGRKWEGRLIDMSPDDDRQQTVTLSAEFNYTPSVSMGGYNYDRRSVTFEITGFSH